MPELVLPGVYIEVRPEALIVPGPITVGNIGIVGTARRGELGTVHTLSSLSDARQVFGDYDAFDAPDLADSPLTLVRALELAYLNGASTVHAVRITDTEAAAAGDDLVAAWQLNTKARLATFDVPTGGGKAVVLKAKSHGAWGNRIIIEIEKTTGLPGDPARVVLKYLATTEESTVKDGDALVKQIRAGSALVTADPGDKSATRLDAPLASASFAGGSDANAVTDVQYELGLDQLLTVDAHIILAAGQAGSAIDGKLDAHVQNASTDKIKRDRVAITGSAAGATVSGINVRDSDRMVFVQPGVKATDAASGKTVTLPGCYAAAAVAGMLSARDPHISLTNKLVAGITGLEHAYTRAELEQLVIARALALEERLGQRVVKGITAHSGAFRQITTRRIVDFAKFGVRSAADPYIGLLNNDRMRKALKGSINGFLAQMVLDEMLVSYELDVTATRDEEIRGIARVVLTVRPTFSIDYIQVVMFLG